MGIDTALADQPKFGQALDQGGADRGAFTDQDQHLGLRQPLSERVHILHIVVPDGDAVPGNFAIAIERVHRIEIIVENGDVHG